MNKRIKNKINKRIMDKLQNKKEVLTQFEYDYLLKCGPKDLKSMKTNLKIKNGIFVVDGTKIINGEILNWYAANVKVDPFQKLIDAMDSVDSLRYSLENIEAYQNLFNTDETSSILSAGYGKKPKEEPETYFKHIAEIDEETYEDENSEWLGGIDFAKGSDRANTIILEKITPNQLRASMELDEIDAEEFNVLYESVEQNSASHIEISKDDGVVTVKDNIWDKTKSKMKEWFGK